MPGDLQVWHLEAPKNAKRRPKLGVARAGYQFFGSVEDQSLLGTEHHVRGGFVWEDETTIVPKSRIDGLVQAPSDGLPVARWPTFFLHPGWPSRSPDSRKKPFLQVFSTSSGILNNDDLRCESPGDHIIPFTSYLSSDLVFSLFHIIISRWLAF